jgi:hypothetical protein
MPCFHYSLHILHTLSWYLFQRPVAVFVGRLCYRQTFLELIDQIAWEPRNARCGHRPFTLPYEPGYTAHWEEAKRRRATRAFLDAAELARRKSPPITPHLPEQLDSKADRQRPERTD